MNGGDPYVHDSVSCHRSCGYRGEYLPTPEGSRPNICRLRKDRGLTVRDLQHYFGFEEPQAIYKWQRGQSLPSVDNLYALSALLQVPMNEIIISTSHIVSWEQQAAACCSGLFMGNGRISKPLRSLSACTHRPAAILLDGRSPWVNKRLHK